VDPLTLLWRGGAGVEEVIECDGGRYRERDGERVPEEVVVGRTEYGVVQGGTGLAGVGEVPKAGADAIIRRDELEDRA